MHVWTWDQRLIVWAQQLFFVALTLGVIAVLWVVWPGRNVHGSVDADLRAGWVTRLDAIAPCAVSMEYAHPEDELCAVWLEGADQHVVLGPLWARGG
jgi:hypothetical protein